MNTTASMDLYQIPQQHIATIVKQVPNSPMIQNQKILHFSNKKTIKMKA